MEKARDIGEISEEFQPLLNHALEMMNEQPFEYYLSWEGKRYKNKWDIVVDNVFTIGAWTVMIWDLFNFTLYMLF